jgi:hypothetical protein
MANVGTNFQWRKCQWLTSDLTSSEKKIFWTFEALLALPDPPESLSNILASLKKHFGITQKNFMKKKFERKNEKISIVVIFERYAQTNRQTNKFVVYI